MKFSIKNENKNLKNQNKIKKGLGAAYHNPIQYVLAKDD